MKKRASPNDADLKFQRTLFGMLLFAYLALALSVGFYAIWFHAIHKKQLSSNIADWAMFGDFLGGAVGPFIGFVSVFLLVETLKLQQRSLKEQREQLQESAEEAKRQNRILAIQSFEQSFFGWVRDYKNQISYLAFSSDALEPQIDPYESAKTDLFGIKALVSMSAFLMSSPVYEFDSDQKTEGEHTVSQLKNAWKAAQKPRGDTVRAAIRSLYGIIKWVDQQESLSDRDKLHYISIIRAQLTDSELILLFINGLTDRGQKFVHYINKYALFDNLAVEEYAPIQAVQFSAGVSPYKDSAFNTDTARKELGLSGDA
ncbi:putative phage abortive infection protein [Kerstersia gyiorum]|uniref:putative phage abortive infection protein n=1 Tax=Kerstersia gyiorum TaxID=206506 RepID=UPI0021502DF5|nr:putative phage abortive infection protein [Kerstersia gyiorum]MCR4158810.1 putative phage abortive infection protein [Kerstersia gyiorum]